MGFGSSGILVARKAGKKVAIVKWVPKEGLRTRAV
jgi:hypothetical protein